MTRIQAHSYRCEVKVEHWRAGKKYFSVIFHYYISSLPLRKMCCGKVSDVLDSKRKKSGFQTEKEKYFLEIKISFVLFSFFISFFFLVGIYVFHIAYFQK